jgi:hypothetical protein
MIAETICSAVSAAGLGVAAVTAYRKRLLTATRIAAYSLIPIGLVMTGAVAWAVDTAFSLTAWIGFGLLGGSWLLFLLTRTVERRRGITGRKERREAKKAERAAVGPAPAAAPVTPAAAPGKRAATRPPAASAADDFSDIEAILKKHGI